MLLMDTGDNLNRKINARRIMVNVNTDPLHAQVKKILSLITNSVVMIEQVLESRLPVK